LGVSSPLFFFDLVFFAVGSGVSVGVAFGFGVGERGFFDFGFGVGDSSGSVVAVDLV